MHVVGHSLGGLIARYYVQRQGGDRRVESLVTLGTPHQGSVLAHVLPDAAGPPAPARLAAAAGARRARRRAAAPRVTAVYSDLDQMVLPTTAGRCDHPDLGARNVLVRGVGHMSLPIHRGVRRRGGGDPAPAVAPAPPARRRIAVADVRAVA